MDVIEFLTARYDEDEQDVRAREASDESTRKLWEIDAKRKILSEYSSTGGKGVGRVVAVLAAVYADHSDYREEWKP